MLIWRYNDVRYTTLHESIGVPPMHPGLIFQLKKIQIIYLYGETFVREMIYFKRKIIDGLAWLFNKAANYFEQTNQVVYAAGLFTVYNLVDNNDVQSRTEKTTEESKVLSS